MKIIVFGGRGEVGSRIVSEALARGHSVKVVVRNELQGQSLPASVTVCTADVLDTEHVAQLMVGSELAISALRPPDGEEKMLVALTRSVLGAAALSSTRIVVVGGAASLMVPESNGHTVLTAPGFLPKEVVPIAKACQAQYEFCATDKEADWTYFCPPAMLTPGERLGHYRLGSDTLVVDDSGASAISMEDFAVAMIDEAEAPKHRRERFTAAY